MIQADEYLGGADSVTIATPGQVYKAGKVRWVLVTMDDNGVFQLPRGAALLLGYTYIVTATALTFNGNELKFRTFAGNDLLVFDQTGVPRTGLIYLAPLFGTFPVVEARLINPTAGGGAGDWTVFSTGNPN